MDFWLHVWAFGLANSCCQVLLGWVAACLNLSHTHTHTHTYHTIHHTIHHTTHTHLAPFQIGRLAPYLVLRVCVWRCMFVCLMTKRDRVLEEGAESLSCSFSTTFPSCPVLLLYLVSIATLFPPSFPPDNIFPSSLFLRLFSFLPFSLFFLWCRCINTQLFAWRCYK